MALDIGNVVESIYTNLLAQSWPTSGGGASQFQVGYTYPNLENAEGYPFFIIDDVTSPVSSSSENNKYIAYTTTINISFYVNWSVIDKPTEGEKRREAILRLREIQDFLREYVSKDQRRVDWGLDTDAWHNNFSISESDVLDLNLYGRTVSFEVLDAMTRL